MATSSRTIYERQLGSLEGQDFEDEVCTRMQLLVSDFQRIPAKPHGDGGIDGLSHNQARAYCCYGPEQNPAKIKLKGGLKADIVDKFCADLRRLCEVETHGRGRLREAPNAELATILGDGHAVRHVVLVVSWFESHRVIGPLQTAFARYKKASKGRFLHPDATLTIWGPKELAAHGELDELTILRMEQRGLLEQLRNASAVPLAPESAADFDAKFADLKNRRPAQGEAIDALAADFKESWASAVALDNHLASTSVALHEVLEIIRKSAATTARIKSLGALPGHELIEAIRDEVIQRMNESVGSKLGLLTTKVADGVVAGLIGECPIDWRTDAA